MLTKHFLPESFDFGMPAVELIGVGSKGLDKQAMVKRATAFDDILADIKPKDNRTYLHVITTGAMEYFGSNLNNDAFNESAHEHVAPFPEDPSKKTVMLDGGLMKYHDKTYMEDGAVYQEHQTKKAGVDPSGEIVAARYNTAMHRGELLISVDTSKWASRLQRKAQGKNLFLSMGCSVEFDMCFPKGTLVHTADGYRGIETIQVGDLVYTAEGTLAPVMNIMERTTEDRTRINVSGLPAELECTPNHPFLVAKHEVIRACHGSVRHKNGQKKRRHTFDDNGNCITCNKHIDIPHEWVRADEVRDDDYLIAKVEPCADRDTVGTNFAYLCGQYLGDGCLLHAASGHFSDGLQGEVGITIACSGNERDMCIIDSIKSSYLAETGKVAPARKYADKNAYDVLMYDKRLALRIHELCGAGSHTKYIGRDMHTWSRNEKLALLAGLVDSDGCIGEERGAIRIVCSNRGMMLEIQQLCWSVGIRATCYIGNNHPASTFGSTGTSCAVAMYYSYDKLRPYSAKVARIQTDNFNTKAHYKSLVILTEGYAYLPVMDVRTFHGASIAVYNLEVDGSHTYNAEGVIVHNCNICHHIAKTASQHCDHFTKMRGQVLDSGHKCFVINDAPHFYDISGVDVPADRIAFVLRKVASGETTKQASLEAVTQFGYRPAPLYTKAAALASKLARMEKQVNGIEDDLPEASAQSEDAEQDFLSRVENYPTDEVIDSCNRKGMLLTPGMLFKLLGRDCEDPDDRAMFEELDDDCCGDCSTLMEELDESEDKNDVLLDGSFDDILPVDLGLDGILEKLMPELGMTNPAVNGRVIRITITQMKPLHRKQEKKASFNKAATQALRNTYARYLVSFAARNDDATCMNALRKCAKFGN